MRQAKHRLKDSREAVFGGAGDPAPKGAQRTFVKGEDLDGLFKAKLSFGLVLELLRVELAELEPQIGDLVGRFGRFDALEEEFAQRIAPVGVLEDTDVKGEDAGIFGDEFVGLVDVKECVFPIRAFGSEGCELETKLDDLIKGKAIPLDLKKAEEVFGGGLFLIEDQSALPKEA